MRVAVNDDVLNTFTMTYHGPSGPPLLIDLTEATISDIEQIAINGGLFERVQVTFRKMLVRANGAVVQIQYAPVI